MFPLTNLDPKSTAWTNKVQEVIQDTENRQPILEQNLDLLRKDSLDNLTEVSSRLNAYYQNTLVQYPVKLYPIPLRDAFGAASISRSISAPTSANNTVAENWVSVFTHNITLPNAVTTAGFRLNVLQMLAYGSSTYSLRYRWRVNGSVEGINSTRWMSRHEFHLVAQTLQTAGAEHILSNRYVHWSGSSTSTFTLEIQACIQNDSNLNASVASQSITFEPTDLNGRATYLDVMVTV
jgi:hypothetical protein